jgi:hypothetical protein
MLLRPLQLEVSAAVVLAGPHKDPANPRDENVLMLGVLTRRMLERPDEARDL